MKSIAYRPLIMLSVASVLLAFGVAASGESADALLRRYPYDPACPWGRIGNGKGIIVRCLSEGEASALRAGTVPAAPPLPSASAAPSSATNPAAASPPPPTNASSPPSDEPNEVDAGAPSATDEKFDISVGPVTADSGELGIGKLGQPKDRYAKCINDNGGLKDGAGEVQVRFLVRQRGRAEGVSVNKRTGLSQEAARCVSEVVDRRYVGVPDAPIVGATVVIKFAKAAK
jgi:hypothetical protein